jgi:hypothetical protein
VVDRDIQQLTPRVELPGHDIADSSALPQLAELSIRDITRALQARLARVRGADADDRELDLRREGQRLGEERSRSSDSATAGFSTSSGAEM